MSVNIANGFALLDQVDAAPAASQSLKDAVNAGPAAIQGWLRSPADYRRGLRAQRQRQGEYGHAAREALSATTALFGKGLARHFEANVDLHFDLNAFTAATRGADALASLSGREVRSRNGGYDFCPAPATVWADFHGGWAMQKAKANLGEYEYDGYGFRSGSSGASAACWPALPPATPAPASMWTTSRPTTTRTS